MIQLIQLRQGTPSPDPAAFAGPGRRAGRPWAVFLLLLLWWGAIWGFSNQPYREQDFKPWLRAHLAEANLRRALPPLRFSFGAQLVDTRADPYGALEFFIRKAAHLAEYAVLAAVLTLLFRSLGLGPVPAALLALFFAAGLSAGDEVHQLGVSGRTGRPQDVWVDLWGALTGCALLQLILPGSLERRPGDERPGGRGLP